MGLYKHDRLML